MATLGKIAPCLWFDSQAEDAARHYCAIFENSSIGAITRYGKAGYEVHKRPEGSVMTVDFTLDGQEFTALNGGPVFRFNEAISFMVYCEDQKEIDYFWGRLGEGGDPKAQQCGWLKDKFGMSWQIVTRGFNEMMNTSDGAARERAFSTMMQMKKLDIAALERAFQAR